MTHRFAVGIAMAVAVAWTGFGETVSGVGKVQLWKGGPYWADRNIGAENPWECGLYFWWGDTVGHGPSGLTFDFSFAHSSCPTHGKGRDQLRSEGWITSEGTLAPSHDAAHVKWGEGWRMPTHQDISNLNSKCDWIWSPRNGMVGYLVRGRGEFAANSIFLPCAGCSYGTSLYDSNSDGYYWSASLVPGGDYVWYLSLDYSSHAMSDSSGGDGRTIRPVHEAAE